MKWRSRFFDFYLDASVHVALAIVSLSIATGLILNIPVNFHLILFLFFGSISCYNFVKYGVEAEKYLKLTNSYHKGIQIFSIAALLIAGYHAHFLAIETLIAVGVLVVLTGLYALPLLPKSKNLRSLGGLKIFVVAAVWAGATVGLPIIEAGLSFIWDHGIAVLQRFLIVLILLLPFEIRDLSYDAPELRTLPKRFGVKRTKYLGVVLVLLFLALTYFKDELSSIELLGKLALGVLLLGGIALTREKQRNYFASFWIEGIPQLWLGILYVLKDLF